MRSSSRVHSLIRMSWLPRQVLVVSISLQACARALGRGGEQVPQVTLGKVATVAVQQTLEQEALPEEQLRTRRHVLVEVREVPPRQGARALPSNPRNIRRRLPSETPQPRHGEHPRRGTLEGLRAGGALQGRVARLVGQDQPPPVRLVLAAGPFLRRERVWHPRHHPKVRLG